MFVYGVWRVQGGEGGLKSMDQMSLACLPRATAWKSFGISSCSSAARPLRAVRQSSPKAGRPRFCHEFCYLLFRTCPSCTTITYGQLLQLLLVAVTRRYDRNEPFKVGFALLAGMGTPSPKHAMSVADKWPKPHR